ncbi:MAG TPA: iron ABC transporter permease [Anaerolineae bacterium]|nr:iron ABC transporter permease [Anaerolineae bacterium]
MLSRLRMQHLIFAVAVLLLLVLVGLPLGLLFYKSFVRDGTLTLANYMEVFSDQRNYLPFWNTVKLGFWTVALATALGLPLGWLVARTDLPGRGFLELLCLLPYMLPPFIGAIAWTQLLAPRVGYMNKLWMLITHSRNSLFNLYSFEGMVWVLGMYTFPFVFITVRGALARMNPSLEEVARISGAGKLRVLKDITIPLVLPSIMAGMILAFLYAISNFGVPALIGMRGRVFVVTTQIFWYVYQHADFTGIRLATSLSVILVGVAGLVLWLNRWVLSRQHGAAIISGKSVRPTIVELGRWKYPLAVTVHLFIAFLVLAPLVSVFLSSFLKAWGLPIRWENLTVGNYRYILFEYSLTRKAILNSLMLAVSAATSITLIGGVLAYITVKTKIRGRQVLDFLSTLPHAIPGTVVALAMILAWSGQFKVNLYNTFWIILVAYVARYMFYGFRNISASLVQIHPSLEEAARISGASWVHNFRDIVVPLIKPGLIAGWLLVFMPTLRELTVSILLYGPKTPTISVAVFELQDAGYYHIAAALSALIVVVLLICNYIARKLIGLGIRT